MELEELKASWNVLNEELKKQTVLNREMAMRMLRNKGESALSSLMLWEGFGVGVAVVLALSGILVYLVTHWLGQLLLGELVVLLILAWQLYKYCFLKNIRLEELSVCDAFFRINKYKKMLIGEILSTPFILVPWFFVLDWGQEFVWRKWVFMIIACLICVPPLYMYYWRRIAKLRQSLEELKEFESE